MMKSARPWTSYSLKKPKRHNIYSATNQENTQDADAKADAENINKVIEWYFSQLYKSEQLVYFFSPNPSWLIYRPKEENT